jgi:hypothetical protein
VYERILPYYGSLRQRSLCWLRLFPSSGGTVVIFSEIPGNPGASVTNAIEYAALTVVEAYAIAPNKLTVFEHYPLDDEGSGPGVYDMVHLNWLPTSRGFHVVGDPEWSPVERIEVESLVNHDLTPRAFWQRLAIPASHGRPSIERWVCEVGKRRGDAWHPTTHATWLGNVLDYRRGEWDEGGFQSRTEAQTWVLNLLAHLAGEFDEVPPSR